MVIYIELFFEIGVYMSFIKSKKFIIPVCAVVLVIAIVVAVVVIASRPVELKNYSFIAEDQAFVQYGQDFNIAIKGNNSEKMLFNSKNGAVALVSSDGAIVYNSCSEDASEYSLATVLSIRLRDSKGNSYTMNSTDNSVAFGSFSIDEKGNNKVSIRFNIFPDQKRADKGIDNADIFASVTVDFGYENGAFKSTVNTRNVKLPEDFVLEKISILPGLFSVNSGVDGEMYAVPEGCGALVNLNTINKDDYSLDLAVYGEDVALYGQSRGAYLPYYSYIKSDCFVNTVITEGDALSEISFKKFSKGGGYLYNTFTVTACGVLGDNYVSGPSYEGNLTQVYYLTEENADYNEIAHQVRDILISKGYLADNLSSPEIAMPVFVNVIGSEDGGEALTTFDEAAEITTMLKSKGVSNIYLRFVGAGKDGLNTTAGNSLDFSSSLGGKSGAIALGDKMNSQGNTLYIDFNMLAGKADYKKSVVNIYSDISAYADFNKCDFTTLETSMVDDNVSKAYKYYQGINNLNICVNDGSQLLYTDVKGGVNRQSALKNMQGYINSLSATSRVTLAAPSTYILKYVDGVFALPESTNLQVYSGVTAVPILQIALHGSILYGSNPMNVSALSAEDTLLKAVEYGAVPSFLFTHSELESLGYSAYVNAAASIYDSASRTRPLLGMSISSHQLVASGVYKVIYDYSKIVYVNYNPSVVEVDGVMVPAKDFIVI